MPQEGDDRLRARLVDAGVVGLDYFGRFECIELALDDAHAKINAQLPPLMDN